MDWIFNDNPSRSHGAWIRAYDSLHRYQDQLITLITKSRHQTTFITDFDQFGGRVLMFLQNADNYLPRTPEGYRSRKSLGILMIDKLMVQLLDSQYQHLRDSEIFFELLMCMLLLADKTGNHLQGLAAYLADTSSLLGKVISSDLSSDFLGDWVDSLGKSHPNATTLGGWMEVAANLIDACTGGHDVEEVLDRWKSLKLVKEHLHASQVAFKYNPNYHIRFSGDMHTLRGFGLAPPDSEATLKSAIEVVDIKLTAEILSALIKSMPCRLCFSNCAGGEHTSTLKSHPRHGSGGDGWFDANQLQYEDLLGKSLGRWKIVLSAQALKDLQNSHSEGSLFRVPIHTDKFGFPNIILTGQTKCCRKF